MLMSHAIKIITGVCFCIALLAGCDSSSTSTAKTMQTEPQPIIEEQASVALVMKTLANPIFVAMERGARRAEQEFNIDLVVKTAAQETSIQHQIAIVESLIQDAVDAIVIAPGDSVELIPVLKRAQDAGIKVINIDNRLDPDFAAKHNLTSVPFISVDNETSAYLSAKYIADQIKEPTKAVLMEGIRGAINAKNRKAGAMRAFSENSNITLVASKTANWKIDESMQLMQAWLVQYPDLGLVFAANDMMALGVINALHEANREDVLVASFDALDQAIAAVGAGMLQVTVDQLPEEQGYQGVVYALKSLRGEPLPEITLVDAKLITKATIGH